MLTHGHIVSSSYSYSPISSRLPLSSLSPTSLSCSHTSLSHTPPVTSSHTPTYSYPDTPSCRYAIALSRYAYLPTPSHLPSQHTQHTHHMLPSHAPTHPLTPLLTPPPCRPAISLSRYAHLPPPHPRPTIRNHPETSTIR